MKNQVAIAKLTFLARKILKVILLIVNDVIVITILYITEIDKNCKCISVILSPGDVLFVPHKWWHYVENLTTAVSINAWIQVPKLDNVARLKESVVRFMAGSICSVTVDTLHKQLLNPNEVIYYLLH